MKCLKCLHWKALKYQFESGVKQPEMNDAECEKIKDLLDIDLGCMGYGCGGEFVDEIWTNQDFFCAGFEKRV